MLIASKIIDWKAQIDNLAKIYVKKRHNSAKILRIALFFKLDLYLMILDPSVKFKWNRCIPARVIN